VPSPRAVCAFATLIIAQASRSNGTPISKALCKSPRTRSKMIATKLECKCGSVVLDIEINQDRSMLSPRKCDCDFCVEKNLVYLSDPEGKVSLNHGELKDFHIQKQGSQSASFLSCKSCGSIVLVTYEDHSSTFCAINYQLLDQDIGFGEVVNVSPKKLSADEKISRWKSIWFKNVNLGGRIA